MGGFYIVIWLDHVTVIYIAEYYYLCYLGGKGVYEMDAKSLGSKWL